MKAASRNTTVILVILTVTFVFYSFADPGNPRGVERILSQAKEAERKQNFDQAIALYQKVITEYPEMKFDNEIRSGKFADVAKDRIKVLTCRKKKGPDFSTESPSQFADLLKTALTQKNQENLARYASCDFEVGPYASDNMWTLLPGKAIPVILQYVDSFDLASMHVEQYKTGKPAASIEFSDSHHKDIHSFYISKQGRAWVWTFYGTSNSLILDKLFIAKKESGGE